MAGKRSILIINPNSTASMTEALNPLVHELGFSDTTHAFFTAPSGPPSINSASDADESASHCLPHLQPLLSHHDAFLVACSYSPHPLVRALQSDPTVRAARKPVTGIFEASVAASLQLLPHDQRFGIVSTGKAWEATLAEGVREFLGFPEGVDTSARFAGVETTGLAATELHEADPQEVRRRMKEATKRLVGKGSVGAVCLGCAGMAGMDEMVREACIEELGEREGRQVRIVDGVVAGVGWLEGALRGNL